ncbi:MAG: GNAT family N-acetyltransferase [Acidobacteriota bacterium]|nr:GNAT family N-acetyltransferase [Acidobacteriota bacterium]
MALEEALKWAGLPFRKRRDGTCPYIIIDGAWATTAKRLGSRFRKRLARNRRLLAANGCTTRVIERPMSEPGLFDQIVALESLKRIPGVADCRVLSREPRFFGDLFRAVENSGSLYLALLEKQGRLVAYEIGFRCGGSMWVYNKAYDLDFASYSPGTALIPEVLDYAWQRGIPEFDFLRGEEEYKRRWTTLTHQNARFEIWNRRVVSRVAGFLAFSIAPAGRETWRIIRRLPEE